MRFPAPSSRFSRDGAGDLAQAAFVAGAALHALDNLVRSELHRTLVLLYGLVCGAEGPCEPHLPRPYRVLPTPAGVPRGGRSALFERFLPEIFFTFKFWESIFLVERIGRSVGCGRMAATGVKLCRLSRLPERASQGGSEGVTRLELPERASCASSGRMSFAGRYAREGRGS